MTEILYQILLVVGIAVGLLLIVNLWRLFSILKRVNSVTALIDAQVRELNGHLVNIESFLGNLPETIRIFLNSFDVLRSIKDKIGGAKSENKKGAEDEQ